MNAPRGKEDTPHPKHHTQKKKPTRQTKKPPTKKEPHQSSGLRFKKRRNAEGGTKRKSASRVAIGKTQETLQKKQHKDPREMRRSLHRKEERWIILWRRGCDREGRLGGEREKNGSHSKFLGASPLPESEQRERHRVQEHFWNWGKSVILPHLEMQGGGIKIP